HQEHIIPVVDAAIKESGMPKSKLSAIAYTQGPGLLGSLLVGASFAKGMSQGLDIPLVEVNHLQAHILSLFIAKEGEETRQPPFPFLCLTVSGGHTQIVHVRGKDEMEILGRTLDDAAGEAFDKGARVLGLEYPGGPLIDRFARQGDPEKFRFPHPEISGYNYSFSGLKTAFLYFVRDRMNEDENFISDNLPHLCASLQKSIADILLDKLQRAAQDSGITHIAIAGGVSANSGLRHALQELAVKNKWKIYHPDLAYCTDNAAMIATAGYFKYLSGDMASITSTPEASLPF
ncbi:MAG: tRNA (adenosine(37)-N6)-threonylcarbamoyltransferase complex transferase subunit TsaD, partial [Flavobacteriales bacterium]